MRLFDFNLILREHKIHFYWTYKIGTKSTRTESNTPLPISVGKIPRFFRFVKIIDFFVKNFFSQNIFGQKSPILKNSQIFLAKISFLWTTFFVKNPILTIWYSLYPLNFPYVPGTNMRILQFFYENFRRIFLSFSVIFQSYFYTFTWKLARLQ